MSSPNAMTSPNDRVLFTKDNVWAKVSSQSAYLPYDHLSAEGSHGVEFRVPRRTYQMKSDGTIFVDGYSSDYLTYVRVDKKRVQEAKHTPMFDVGEEVIVPGKGYRVIDHFYQATAPKFNRKTGTWTKTNFYKAYLEGPEGGEILPLRALRRKPYTPPVNNDCNTTITAGAIKPNEISAGTLQTTDMKLNNETTLPLNTTKTPKPSEQDYKKQNREASLVFAFLLANTPPDQFMAAASSAFETLTNTYDETIDALMTVMEDMAKQLKQVEKQDATTNASTEEVTSAAINKLTEELNEPVNPGDFKLPNGSLDVGKIEATLQRKNFKLGSIVGKALLNVPREQLVASAELLVAFLLNKVDEIYADTIRSSRRS